MGVTDQLRAFSAVLPRARRHRMDLLRNLSRRPQVLGAVGVYETALLFSGRVDARVKALAELKAAAMINCEYCIDIGSALSRRAGVTPAQIQALAWFQDSDEFDDTDKLVLELAAALTRTPALIEVDLRTRLDGAFSRTQQVELMAAIAWENHRGRLNQALGVRPSGFSDGDACAVPEPAFSSVADQSSDCTRSADHDRFHEG